MRVFPVAVLILSIHFLAAVTIWDQPGHLLRPNLLLLPVIYFALWFPLRQAVVVAIAAGLLQDLYSLDPVGLSALSFAASAVAVAAVREEVFREHPVTQVLLGGVAALVAAAVTVAYLRAPSVLGPAALQALQTALFAPLIIMPLQALGSLWGQPAPYRSFPHRI